MCTYGEEVALKKTLKKHTIEISALSESPNGKILLSGDSNRTIFTWSADDLEAEPRKFLAHNARIVSFDWEANSGSFASTSTDQMIIIWDIEKGKVAEINSKLR